MTGQQQTSPDPAIRTGRYFQTNVVFFQKKKGSKKMAGVAGLEPVTSAVTGQRSNQLSYTPA
jgi:hypothetical protein